MKRLVVLAAALVALAGCAPDGGTVQDRQHRNPCVGKYRALCSDDPELYVSNPGQHNWPYTDRPAAGWVKVSERAFQRCPIGAAYPACVDGAR